MKRTPLILFTILIILLVILFLLLSCESENPTTEQAEQNELTTPEALETPEPDVEKQIPEDNFNIDDYSTPFIEANIQFSCEIIRNPDLTTSEGLMRQRLAQIYKEKGFPTHDDNQMILILQKYEKDEDTTNTIREGTAECLAE